MEVFKLKEGEAYIELNNLLKRFNWVASGGEAKTVIKEGQVSVNGETETRVRKKMFAGDNVIFAEKEGKVE
ncbi:MAG TPA: RNA-binding S4 domain-containing protein [Fulvivirga sp.]|nr:RNA-binding S4 domain-containing protein [Fulvivirga sp.]